ncbi:MAG TPA: hypothetical protein VFM51_07100 [Solirubrobacterales bacterium]|nr:hypothetical protein [Solirubrobacterales bacterium]
MAGRDSEPLSDPVAEGIRIADAATEQRLPLRVLGGVAVAILCPSSRRPPLARQYGDIDFATVRAAKDGVVALMESLGYTANKEFNMLHGHRRLCFWDEVNQRQVDVFVDEANLCHRIDLKKRIELVPLTVSVTDLTLLKLQVVETNEKDLCDICAIFADHDLTEDEEGVNATYIAALTASNWGLWKTIGMVAERSERFALGLAGFEARELVAERLRRLRTKLDTIPKTRSWKLRARVGERKRWYEIPEEMH